MWKKVTVEEVGGNVLLFTFSSPTSSLYNLLPIHHHHHRSRLTSVFFLILSIDWWWGRR
jgi:hypothetical protein